jgi:hypothetical protein
LCYLICRRFRDIDLENGKRFGESLTTVSSDFFSTWMLVKFAGAEWSYNTHAQCLLDRVFNKYNLISSLSLWLPNLFRVLASTG